MKLILDKEESVEISFMGGDGEITVRFGPTYIAVVADLPDSKGREGVIYFEDFTPCETKEN
jgi:hypothetical protein